MHTWHMDMDRRLDLEKSGMAGSYLARWRLFRVQSTQIRIRAPRLRPQAQRRTARSGVSHRARRTRVHKEPCAPHPKGDNNTALLPDFFGPK